MGEQTSNKRIVKNTVFLYLRMLLLMLISFYTSRVVLKALGADDFGVYNVVGGIVAMIGFVSSSMTLASNRFFAYAIGKKDSDLLIRTYSTSVIIQFLFSIALVILAETLGIWYFYNYLNIPPSSVEAAMWVYQISIISTFIGLNTVPTMSLIIAHEDMGAYAYVSLIEGGLKLGVALLLAVPLLGNLKAYATMVFLISLIIRGIWYFYANHKYPLCKFNWRLDRKIFKDIYSFIGWQIFSSLSWLLRNQGVNLVLNYFFGPLLNTARSLALQVNSGITSLVNNFQMASNPQLVKYYASGEIEKMQYLLFRSSKLSFLLLFIFAFPILIEAQNVLQFWLGEIPEYVLVFVQLIIIATLVDSLSGTLQHTALATGKIVNYTKVVTTIMLSDIVLVFAAFKLGMPPTAMIYAEMVVYFLAFVARLFISRKLFTLSIRQYLKNVTSREIYVTIVSVLIFLIYSNITANIEVHFIFELIALFIIGCIVCFFIGLTKSERIWAKELLLASIGH